MTVNELQDRSKPECDSARLQSMIVKFALKVWTPSATFPLTLYFSDWIWSIVTLVYINLYRKGGLIAGCTHTHAPFKGFEWLSIFLHWPPPSTRPGPHSTQSFAIESKWLTNVRVLGPWQKPGTVDVLTLSAKGNLSCLFRRDLGFFAKEKYGAGKNMYLWYHTILVA